jgi:hypothetical protein
MQNMAAIKNFFIMCLCFLNFHTAKLFPMTDFSNTGLACLGKWDASFGK